MTNADKYLKDEVDIKEFSRNMFNYLVNRDEPLKIKIENFLEEDIPPTLTEDERVILRNIQKGLLRKGIISRTKTGELLVYIQETGEIIEFYIFNHLFQFIKERRRILY